VQKPSNVVGQCGLCNTPDVALCYSDLLPQVCRKAHAHVSEMLLQ
jgi:hypothetical protein